MDGWVFDEKCIARQSDIKGSHLPLDKIVHFEVLQEAVDSVLNGSVSISYFLIFFYVDTRLIRVFPKVDHSARIVLGQLLN